MAHATYIFSVIYRVTNSDDVSSHLHQIFKNYGFVDYVFQLEKGSTDNFHWQCFTKARTKIRASTLQNVLSESCLPNCRSDVSHVGVKPSSSAGKDALKRYCMKSDTRVIGPFGLRPLYLGQDLRCMNNPHPWQQSILQLIQQEPDDRTIVWIYNQSGNVGKSKLMKYCKFNGLSVRIPLGTATQIKTSVITKGPHRCYMLDLPRVRGKDERIQEVFSAIEEIKNGWVESAMYGKTEELMMMPPHVFVFSNEPPNLTYASADRWKVRSINDQYQLCSYSPVVPNVPK